MATKKRKWNELRKVKITRGVMKNAEGSAMIEMGDTKVICTASIEERVPGFLRDTGKGWVTTEYAMLPRSTNERMRRDSTRGHIGGRSYEIQRIIGRALRAVIDLEKLGERSITLDCDVIQADGGTRTASITGAYVALYEACKYMKKNKLVEELPLTDFIAAVSVGIIDGKLRLDLDYELDSRAEVDMNVAMTGSGQLSGGSGDSRGCAFLENEIKPDGELGGEGY